MSTSISRERGYALAVFAAVLWGLSGTFGQFLFEHRGLHPQWLVSVRMLVSGLLLVGYSALRNRATCFRVWRDRGEALRILAFGLFGMVGVQYTYFTAIHESNAATATVLQYLGPLFIALYYAVRDRRLPNLTESLALTLAVAGTFFLVTHGSMSSLSITPIALAWGIASAIGLAFYSIQPIGLLERHPASVVVGWGMLIGGVALAVVNPPWRPEGQFDLAAIASVAYIIVFATLIAFYSYLVAVKVVGAKVASLLACAEPLSATVAAVLWLKIAFGAFDGLGTAFILAAIWILTTRGKRDER